MEELAAYLFTIAKIVGALTVILTPFWIAVYWLYRKLFRPIHILIKRELTPNGGQSMRDEIIMIGAKVDKILTDQIAINDRIDTHFLWSRAFTKKLVTGEIITDSDLESENR